MNSEKVYNYFHRGQRVYLMLNRIFWRMLKWEYSPLIVIVLLASPVFLLRDGDFQPDIAVYLEVGRRLATGYGYIPAPESFYSHLSTVRAPLYPFLFTLAFKLFGISVSSALLVTKAAVFGSMVVTYLLLKKVYNVRTGLVAAALIPISFYIFTFPASLNNDLVMAFFMLLSLYFSILSLDKSSFRWAVAAGMAIGIGFMVKELAAIWAPLVLYLLLGVPRWRELKNIKCLIGYGIGASVFPGFWFLWYYLHTGDIYLLARIPVNIFYLITGPVLIVAGLLILFYLLRRELKENINNLLQNPSNKRIYLLLKFVQWFFLWLCWLLVTGVFTIILANRSVFRFESILEIPLRIEGFIALYNRRILSANPLFEYLFWTIIIVIISALILKKFKLGDHVLFWAALACIPLILTMQIPNGYEFPFRYLMPLYWIAYMVLGRAIVILADLLNYLLSYTSISREKIKLIRPTNFLLLPLLLFSFTTGWKTSNSFIYDYTSPSNYNHPQVHMTVDWITANIVPGTNLAAGTNYFPAFDFFTDGAYNIYRWGVENRESSEIIWPYQKVVVLQAVNGELQLRGALGNSVNITKPMYIQHHLTRTYPGDTPTSGGAQRRVNTVPRFATFSENELLNFIETFEIDYFIFPEAIHHRTLHVVPDFFKDHPAFEEVFVTSWEESGGQFAINIYKVDRTLLNKVDYPIIVTRHVWPGLIDLSMNLLHEAYNLNQVIHALGGGPIIFRPSSPENYKYYVEVAETYFEQNDIDLAAFQYHLALLDIPERLDDITEIALRYTTQFPEIAASWLLLGDVRFSQGRDVEARWAYNQALSASEGSKYSYSAAHRGLGNIAFSEGLYSEALEQYQIALDLSIFGAENFYSQMNVAQANIYMANGYFDRAISIYNNVFNVSAPFGGPEDYVYHDFVREIGKGKITTGGEDFVYPSIFLFQNQPRPVLYAHPPSYVRSQFLLSTQAVLHFAPTLAPAVWQPGKGDGVLFEIFLDTSDGTRYRLYNEYIDPKNLPEHRQWLERQVDLSRWAGETVTISFVTGCGPNNDCRYDWAGWGEPRILQPVSYDFLDNFSEENLQTGEIDLARRDKLTIDYETRPILFQHPRSQVVYNLTLPQQPTLKFGLGMDPQVWQADMGDGVEYSIYVRSPQEPHRLYRMFNRYLDPKNDPGDRMWFDEQIDLSRFGGQQVEIIFEALPGPADDYAFDWGGWSAPVLIDDTRPGQEVETGSIP